MLALFSQVKQTAASACRKPEHHEVIQSQYAFTRQVKTVSV